MLSFTFLWDLLSYTGKLGIPQWHDDRWENLKLCQETDRLHELLDLVEGWPAFFKIVQQGHLLTQSLCRVRSAK